MQHFSPAAAYHLFVCHAHLFRRLGVVQSSYASPQAGNGQAPNGSRCRDIVPPHRYQRCSHGEVGIDGAGDASRNAHRRGRHHKGEPAAWQFNDQGRSDRKLSQVMLGDGGHDPSLRFPTMKVVDGLVDPATHVPEAVGWTHNRITSQIQEVPLDNLDGGDIRERRRQRARHLRIHITKADLQRIGWECAERFESLHAPAPYTCLQDFQHKAAPLDHSKVDRVNLDQPDCWFFIEAIERFGATPSPRAGHLERSACVCFQSCQAAFQFWGDAPRGDVQTWHWFLMPQPERDVKPVSLGHPVQ